MEIADLLVDCLACARISRLIVADTIFDRPRARVFQALHEAGWERGKDLLRCQFCVSVYAGFGIVALRRAMPRAWSPVARALALSSVAGVVASIA